MNYTTLQADVAEYLDRTDLSSRIREFISLAEHRIMHDLKFRGNETGTSVTLTSGTDEITPPARFRSVIMLLDENSKPIERRTISFLRQHKSSLTTATGAPQFYALFNDKIFVSPVADQGYTLSLRYYEEVEELSTSNPSNYFTGNTPNLLLYGTLLEAAPYLHNDERVQLWQASYDRFLQSILEDQKFYGTDEAVQ